MAQDDVVSRIMGRLTKPSADPLPAEKVEEVFAQLMADMPERLEISSEEMAETILVTSALVGEACHEDEDGDRCSHPSLLITDEDRVERNLIFATNAAMANVALNILMNLLDEQAFAEIEQLLVRHGYLSDPH